MPITTRANMKVYDPRSQAGYRERNAQVIDLFNGASKDTIRLATSAMPGDFDFRAFFRRQSGLITRRDPTSTAAVADQNIQQDEKVAVKLNRKFGPVSITADMMRKIGESVSADDDLEDHVMYGIGDAAADQTNEDKLNIALAATAAAVRANAALVHDTSAAAGGVTSAKLNTMLFKRGDRSSDIEAFVMHSSQYAGLIDNQIATNATGVASVVMAGGTPLTFNRPVLVTDSPSLVIAGSPNKYITLGLVKGAVVVTDTEEELMISEWLTGLENLAIRTQGEYAFTLEIEGFSWDAAAGGVNPTNAALATGANWLSVVQSMAKSAAGLALVTQ